MKVTFDTNTFRKVVLPENYKNDCHYQSAKALHNAISEGRILPFMSATIFSLETVLKEDRAAFLASNRLKFESREKVNENKIHFRVCISPDHGQHPGLTVHLKQYFEAALKLGFKVIQLPRLGQPYPEEIRHDLYPERFAGGVDWINNTIGFDVERKMEEIGVGYGHITRLLQRIEKRTSISVPPRELLTNNEVFNDDERKELARAVAEWSDGDSVAAHIAHGFDFFCTQDKAGGRSNSVFSETNLVWLRKDYGFETRSIDDLNSLLSEC